MKFLRKREEYEVEYTKSQAKKALLEDPRIEGITTGFNKMTIHTIPIKPENSMYKKASKMILYPVGTYKIKLTKGRGRISVQIVRKEGTILDGAHSPHIKKGYVSGGEVDIWGGICWGNLYKEMKVMQRNKDWYWIVKRSLDLLMDFADGCKILALFQLDYMKNDPKVKKKLEKCYRKIMRKKLEW